MKIQSDVEEKYHSNSIENNENNNDIIKEKENLLINNFKTKLNVSDKNEIKLM